MRGQSVFLVIGGLALSGTARADAPYMWAAGGHLGTMVFPGAYPALWPARINSYDVDGDGDTELGPNGNELASDLEKVRGDVILAAEGYYWLNRDQRIGGYAGYGGGTGFSDVNLVLKYDQLLTSGGDLDLYVGGGLGFGSSTFKGLLNDGTVDPDPNAERLVINYFPARVELSPLIRLDTWGVQPKLWGGLNIPSSHRWTVDGAEVEGIQGTLFNYITFGIEIGILGGDLKPPKKKGKKGKGGGGRN